MIHTELFHSLEQVTYDLPALWHTAESCHFPIALWRLPQRTERHLVIDLSGQPVKGKPDLEVLPAGFLFSPFLNEDGSQTRLVTADIHFRIDADGQLTLLRKPQTSHSAYDLFLERLTQYQASASPKSNISSIVSETTEAEKQYYIRMVEKGIEAIDRGEFQKVALARTKDVALPAHFDVLSAFERLCTSRPDAFVSLVSVPGEGRWMGASPEILISVDKNGLFRTVSLAGTQAVQSGASTRDANWTHKEIEEQALVSRYIINCFKKIRLREYEEVGPRTVIAGNLMHLRTDFTVDTEAMHFPQLGTVMLELLHPTSAVCGMPKPAAMAFIAQHEQQDRGFYSGYLGPVNIGDESHLFVNLRCMHLRDGTARLYAGAGITSESVAEREWQETELKCQTMLKIL